MSFRQTESPGALAGVNVLEMSALLAGPSCAKYLAEHGAEVVKLERYPGGDISRNSFTKASLGRSPMFMQNNAGKYGLCVDIKKPEGLAIVKALVPKVDVVVQAFTPGTMDKVGLGYEALQRLNPKVILCSISGFGQTGPLAARPGYAHLSHAMSGWLATQFMRYDPPQAPRGPGVAIADMVAGLTAFGAIGAALFRRERTGRGEHVDVALFDALFSINDFAYQSALLEEAYDLWYHPVHKSRDGYITANVGPDFRAWANLCKAMRREDLLDDPRFCDQAVLLRNLAAAVGLVSEWMLEHDGEEIEALLTANHVACGIVYDIEDAIRQPQVAARGLTQTLEDPVRGPTEVMTSAFHYTEASTRFDRAAPTLGQDNAYVLAQWLGYDDTRIEALYADGVLQSGEQ